MPLLGPTIVKLTVSAERHKQTFALSRPGGELSVESLKVPVATDVGDRVKPRLSLQPGNGADRTRPMAAHWIRADPRRPSSESDIAPAAFAPVGEVVPRGSLARRKWEPLMLSRTSAGHGGKVIEHMWGRLGCLVVQGRELGSRRTQATANAAAQPLHC